MANLWAARKECLWATLAVKPEGTQIWSTDVAVPLSRMAEIIGQFSTGGGIIISEKLTYSRTVKEGIGESRALLKCSWACRWWKLSSDCHVWSKYPWTTESSARLCTQHDDSGCRDGRNRFCKSIYQSFISSSYLHYLTISKRASMVLVSERRLVLFRIAEGPFYLTTRTLGLLDGGAWTRHNRSYENFEKKPWPSVSISWSPWSYLSWSCRG